MKGQTYIREWRNFRGLKQACLASATGLSRALISQIESGKRGYSRESLEAIASALSTREAYLLLCDPNDDPEFWFAWCQLDENQHREAMRDLQQYARRYVIPHRLH